MKTWRRVEERAREAPRGATRAFDVASWIPSRRARMAAFRRFWGPETSVLVLFAVETEQVVRHAGQGVAKLWALSDIPFLVCYDR